MIQLFKMNGFVVQFKIILKYSRLSLPLSLKLSMKINAILLSEFNATSGFKMINSYPPEFISNNQFTLYNELILAREQICGRTLAIQYMKQFILLGVPSISFNKEKKKQKTYERAKFIYSINVIVEKKKYLNYMKKYKQMAKKLSYFFKFIEQSSNVIYNNSQNLGYLQNLLKKIYTQVNSETPCVLSHLSSAYTIVDISFNEKQCEKPIKIKPYHIPITKIKEEQIKQIQSQFGRNLLKLSLAGDYNMKKICDLCEMEEKQIKKYYTKAIQSGLVVLVDMFSYHNRYALTQKFLDYLPDRQRHSELKFICKSISKDPRQMIEPMELLTIYFTVSRNCSLDTILSANLNKFRRINLMKWVRLSQIFGIFTRVYQKFALTERNEQSEEEKSFIQQKNVHKVLLPREKSNSQLLKNQHRRLNMLFESHLKNRNTIDEICIDLEIGRETLMKLLDFNKEYHKQLQIFLVIEDS